MSHKPISKELFSFFKTLKRNNNREWFQKNKSRYEERVRDPLLQLVSDFAPELHKLSPHLVADPRPVGGSLFRIYRDVRFSKDKTPYKTGAGVRFPNEDAKKLETPGYYLHMEPGAVFAAGGVWHPSNDTLRKIRDGIVADPKGYQRAVSGKAFKASCKLEGDSLKRPPKGYDPEHPLIDELKRKDFIAVVALSETDACAKTFKKDLARHFRTMVPYMRFLTAAVGGKF